MKNWDLSKWPPIGRGLLTGSRSERSLGWGEGRGRGLGCNGRNHPSVNDLPPPLFVVHDARREATPTGPPPARAGPRAAGLCRWRCLRCAPKFSDGPRFSPARAKQATSLGCIKDKAQPDSQPFPPCSAPASPVPSPTAGEQGLGADAPSRHTHRLPPPTN